MRKLSFIPLGVLLGLPLFIQGADEKKKPAVPATPITKPGETPKTERPALSEGQKKLAEIRGKFSKLQQEAMKEYSEAKTNEERQALIPKTQEKINNIPKTAIAQEALELGKTLPETDPASLDSLVFAMSMANTKNPEIQDQAGKIIVEKHISNPRLPNAFALLSSGSNGPDLMELIASKTKEKSVAAQAWLAAAQGLQKATSQPDQTPKQIEVANNRAEKIFEKLAKEYGDLETGKTTIGELAKKALFEIQNLSIGKKAPEVVCLNINGDKEDKLSNYRGKVVVIDIWATWCGPCRAMIPHEREMVDKLKGKPFTLISVSGDNEKETLTTFLEKEKMPWTHWFAERKGILKDWNIRFYPTIYVLDHKGVIRAKGLRGEALEKKVNDLLVELSKENKG